MILWRLNFKIGAKFISHVLWRLSWKKKIKKKVEKKEKLIFSL
jgi:hypothetical protein